MEVPELLRETIREELGQTSRLPFAIFDFDNTCIVNDVGEATLSYLCQNKLLKDFSLLDTVYDESEYHERVFDAYHTMCEKGEINEAYMLCARTFSGFTPEEARLAALAAIDGEGSEIVTKEVYGRSIPGGLVLNPLTAALFDFVRTLGVAVWVVSASNEVSVQAAMDRFGLKARVIGLRGVLDKGMFTQEFQKPISIMEGKVECVRKYISNDTLPLMVVDDSMTGIVLLETAAIKVAVDKGNALTKEARARGWFIL